MYDYVYIYTCNSLSLSIYIYGTPPNVTGHAGQIQATEIAWNYSRVSLKPVRD